MLADIAIRNFKLYLLSDVKIDSRYECLFSYLNSIFDNLDIYKNAEYEFLENHTFYGTSASEIYIQYEHSSRRKLLSIYKPLMDYLKEKYNISYDGSKTLLKWWVSNFLTIDYKTRVIQGYIYNPTTFDKVGETSWILK